MKKITILTATYNRAQTLPKLYDSLKKQTCKDFVWLVVDDGSNDNTENLINSYITDGILDIKYYKKTNGGKHTVINYALGIIDTDYVFFVDSDDHLTDDCIEVSNLWIEEIDKKRQYMAVSGLRGYPNGQIIGKYPNGKKYKNYIDVNQIVRTKYGVTGDKSEIYRIDYLKKYRFPEFEGEKFIPEGALILQVAQEGYLTRYYNKVNYVCEYLEGGLTRTSNQNYNNFKGFTFMEKLKYRCSPFPYNFLAIVRYCEVARNKGMNLSDISSEMECRWELCLIAEIAGIFRMLIKRCKKFINKSS